MLGINNLLPVDAMFRLDTLNPKERQCMVIPQVTRTADATKGKSCALQYLALGVREVYMRSCRQANLINLINRSFVTEQLSCNIMWLLLRPTMTSATIDTMWTVKEDAGTTKPSAHTW